MAAAEAGLRAKGAVPDSAEERAGEGRGAAARRRCQSAVQWPDGPDGAVVWRPHDFLRSRALALRGSGAAALVAGGCLDVARKGRRVLLRSRRSDGA